MSHVFAADAVEALAAAGGGPITSQQLAGAGDRRQKLAWAAALRHAERMGYVDGKVPKRGPKLIRWRLTDRGRWLAAALARHRAAAAQQ